MVTFINKRFSPRFENEYFGKDLITDFLESQSGTGLPAVNIFESKDFYNIEVAAPGLKKEDFNIDLHNSVLTISSEKEEELAEDIEVIRREFGFSSFKRSFTIPENVNEEKIKATYKNGILSISIPKQEEIEQRPKNIDIS